MLKYKQSPQGMEMRKPKSQRSNGRDLTFTTHLRSDNDTQTTVSKIHVTKRKCKDEVAKELAAELHAKSNSDAIRIQTARLSEPRLRALRFDATMFDTLKDI